MNVIRFIVAVILGVFGIVIIFINWHIFLSYVKTKKSSSSFPFIGAILLCIAFAIIPNNPYAWLCWLAFVIDISSLPGIVYTIICAVKKKYKR